MANKKLGRFVLSEAGIDEMIKEGYRTFDIMNTQYLINSMEPCSCDLDTMHRFIIPNNLSFIRSALWNRF